MKHNRITAVDDNVLLPVFWQTPCYMQVDLSNEMVLIVSRGFGSVCKPQRGSKVSIVSGFCVPFVPVCRLSLGKLFLSFLLFMLFHVSTAQAIAMITDDQVKEQLSIAYVNAVAAMCNYGCEFTRVDIDSVDATITCNGHLAHDSTIRSPYLHLQLKATENLQLNGNSDFPFFLKKKNYDDLRARTLTPRLLVVLNLPTGKTNWLTHSINDLILRNCAYWVNLFGQPDVTNTTGATVYLPSVNHFSPAALQDLMLKVSREQSL